MAISSSLNRKLFTASAAQTVFSFGDVLYFDKTHLEVYVNGVLKTLSTHYTVSPSTNTPNGTPGGTVTFLTAMAGGEQVLILRVVPLVQSIDYQENEKFPANTHEKGLDWLTMAMQQLAEESGRSIQLPVTSTLTGVEVPDPATNVGRGVKVNDAGTGLDTFLLSSTPYSNILTTKGDLPTRNASADARLAVGANNKILVADSADPLGIAWKDIDTLPIFTERLSSLMPNPIINGSMDVWQRTVTGNKVDGDYTADRWQWKQTGSGLIQISQTTDTPTFDEAGFRFNYALSLITVTADASIAASDTYTIRHKIEGYEWRTFWRRPLMISFWVRATKTGTYSFAIRNSSTDRYYIATYTVNTTDTWEYKTIAIPTQNGAGVWNFTTGIGAELIWTMAAGSDFHGTVGAWSTGALYASSSQVNVVDAASNAFKLTGVKLELGTTATPVQYIPFSQELARCMRYFQKSFRYTTVPAQNIGTGLSEFTWILQHAGAVASWSDRIQLSNQLRVPADVSNVTLYNPSAANGLPRNMSDLADHTSPTIIRGTETGFIVESTGLAGSAVGETMGVNWTVNAEL